MHVLHVQFQSINECFTSFLYRVFILHFNSQFFVQTIFDTFFSENKIWRTSDKFWFNFYGYKFYFGAPNLTKNWSSQRWICSFPKNKNKQFERKILWVTWKKKTYNYTYLSHSITKWILENYKKANRNVNQLKKSFLKWLAKNVDV